MNDKCHLALHEILIPAILGATCGVLHLVFLAVGIYRWQPMWLLVSIVLAQWANSYVNLLRARTLECRFNRLFLQRK